VALQRPGLDSETIDTLRTISTESARLTKLLSDLLTLARVDAGAPSVAREPFYLDDVVSDATALMSAVARTKGVALGQGSYEEARVIGDPELVRQLLAILLDNALKYTPAGGSVTTHVFMKDSRAIVAVEDNGPGIEESALPHVFDRFYRSEEARRTAVGAGLGLSIARWIVLVHGAELRVASWPGRGTRIEASFPPSTSS
jgi:signal transduction histidine kinase